MNYFFLTASQRTARIHADVLPLPARFNMDSISSGSTRKASCRILSGLRFLPTRMNFLIVMPDIIAQSPFGSILASNIIMLGGSGFTAPAKNMLQQEIENVRLGCY